LTLDAAIAEAVEHNPDLLALRRMSEVAAYRPAQEHALPAPMLQGQAWQWPINTLNPTNTNMYMLTVSQDLPGRGKRDLRAAVVEKDAAIARTDVDVRAADVLDEVKRTYLELFLMRKAIDIHESNADLLRQVADLSAAKYETGRISQQDVLKAIVELSKLHESLVGLEERAALAEAGLNALLGRAPDAPIGPLDGPRLVAVLPSPAALQQLALDHHPSLHAAVLARERAQASRVVVSHEQKPDFFVAGGYMLMPHGGDAVTGTFGVTWPSAPWARKKIDAEVAQADAEIEAARAREGAAESRVRLDVQNAYVRLQSAQRRASLLETTVIPQSEQALEVSRMAYQTDRADVLSLLDGRRQLLEAQMGYYEALRDAAQAASDLERAVGVEGIATGASLISGLVGAGRLP
jgi:outer membrane protein TolC